MGFIPPRPHPCLSLRASLRGEEAGPRRGGSRGRSPTRVGARLPSPLLRSLQEMSASSDPLPKTPSLGRQSRRHTPPLPPQGLFRDLELRSGNLQGGGLGG